MCTFVIKIGQYGAPHYLEIMLIFRNQTSWVGGEWHQICAEIGHPKKAWVSAEAGGKAPYSAHTHILLSEIIRGASGTLIRSAVGNRSLPNSSKDANWKSQHAHQCTLFWWVSCSVHSASYNTVTWQPGLPQHWWKESPVDIGFWDFRRATDIGPI